MATEKKLSPEETILQEQLAAKTEALEKLSAKVDTLQGTLDQKNVELQTLNEKFDALQEKAAQLEKDYAGKETELADALAINEELTAEVEKLSTGKPEEAVKKAVDFKGLTFENDGQKIGFNYGKTVWKKIAITAEDIANSPTLQSELMAAGHGILKM